MLIREIENPRLKDLWNGLHTPKGNGDATARELLSGIRFVGSGKGALALVLGYLRKQGVLANKLSEVLVPDWMGYWVYNQIQEYAFPVKCLTPRTKAILVYHQY